MRRVTDVEINDTFDATWDNVRIILYIDKQTNGVTATGTEIMESPLNSAILGFRNIENTARFQILADKTYNLRTEAFETISTANTPSWSLMGYVI